MIEFIYRAWNPRAKRDARGRVITDIKRYLASRKTRQKLGSAEISRGRVYEGRKYKVSIKGNVDMRGDTK